MNNRNAQARIPTQQAPASAPKQATHLNVYTVDEYDAGNGEKKKSWTRIGAAFPHKDGIGFSIELRAFPVNGRLVALPPDADDSAK